ncbi:transposase IS66 [Rhodopirellula baltica SH28]|uniref:Transposase IS66 n=1 Tax=Rhodopirellula baltica SH28 TaxID=993517 RepID=K5DD98_RHOBT|nr:transposase IS66 [Rhodopirellula baltica SH28]
MLGDYAGSLIGDCWSGFQKIDVRSGKRIEVAVCWAHARRKIDECRSAFPLQVAKLESLIGMLYDVEDQIKGLGEAEALSRRQDLSRHVLGLIDDCLTSETMSSPAVLPKSNLAQAAAYVRRHWDALNRFTEGASIPLDNNDCEQLMKRVATGRKNWLFKGSLTAGERAANLMTVIVSALRNDLDVHAYLLRGCPASDPGRRNGLGVVGTTRMEVGSPRIESRVPAGRASPRGRPQTHPLHPPPPQQVNQA